MSDAVKVPRKLRTRAQRREYRSRVFWDAKFAAATSPEQEAAVRFDQLRSRIEQLPQARQAGAWGAVSESLRRLGEELAPDHGP